MVCYQLLRNGSNSNLCKSMCHMSYQLKVSTNIICGSSLFFKQMLQLKNRECVKEEDAKCIGNIIDLLFLRDTGCSELSRAEIDCMITFLCTH